MRGSMIMLGAILLPSAASAATFQNGSFELGRFGGGASNAQNLPVGSTAITGWTIISKDGTDVPTVTWYKNGNPLGITASAGQFSLDLSGSNPDDRFGGVRQTFDTVAGHLYSLSFDVGSDTRYTGFPNAQIDALINGTFLFTGSNNNFNSGTQWETNSVQFVATGSSTMLDLVDRFGNGYVGLDDVKVADLTAPPAVSGAVPEPAAWAMMIFGFGAVGWSMRRSRAAVKRISFAI